LFVIHSYVSEYIILAWLVQDISTHGGEETWSMTLRNIYTKLDNKRNLIPGKENNPEERKGKRNEKKATFSSKLHIPA
jgi:hypothetical protein